MEEVTIKKVVIHYSADDFFNQMWNSSNWNPMKWFK